MYNNVKIIGAELYVHVVCMVMLYIYSISSKEHLPEDGHNRWPNHVWG